MQPRNSELVDGLTSMSCRAPAGTGFRSGTWEFRRRQPEFSGRIGPAGVGG